MIDLNAEYFGFSVSASVQNNLQETNRAFMFCMEDESITNPSLCEMCIVIFMVFATIYIVNVPVRMLCFGVLWLTTLECG